MYLRRSTIRSDENVPVPDKLAILKEFFHDDVESIPFPGIIVKIDLPCEDIGNGHGQAIFFPGLIDGVEEAGFNFPFHLGQMPIQDDLLFRCDISITFSRDFIDIG
jgi:hypothetical protein